MAKTNGLPEVQTSPNAGALAVPLVLAPNAHAWLSA